jgi:hypothetical protein
MINVKSISRMLVLLASLIALPTYASVMQIASGLSASGVPVSYQAELSIRDDTLTIVLLNTSLGSKNPDDLLSSYCFDIIGRGNNRPTLTYVSATGDVWQTSQSIQDKLVTASADLKAVSKNDNTWQFLNLDPAISPNYAFGIGTVGNNGLTPNNFNGSIVGNSDYSIYAGDVTTSNLDGKFLVKDSATFIFTGVAGFSEADIKTTSLFGLGTKPDSTLTGSSAPPPPVPEPSTMLLTFVGIAGIVFLKYRR